MVEKLRGIMKDKIKVSKEMTNKKQEDPHHIPGPWQMPVEQYLKWATEREKGRSKEDEIREGEKNRLNRGGRPGSNHREFCGIPGGTPRILIQKRKLGVITVLGSQHPTSEGVWSSKRPQIL